MTKTKKPHGGARARSGPKRKLLDGRAVSVRLDAPTVKVMSSLGESDLSRGVRLSGIIVSLLPPGELERYKTQALEVEEWRIQEVREQEIK